MHRDTDPSAAAAQRSNEEVMRGVMAAFERADVDAILGFYPPDDDFVYVDMIEPESPLRGREAMRRWLTGFYAEVDMTDAELRVLTVTSQGDRVVGELELHAAYVGDGAPTGGMRITTNGCVVQRIVDGVIREERLYTDSAAITRQRERLGRG